MYLTGEHFGIISEEESKSAANGPPLLSVHLNSRVVKESPMFREKRNQTRKKRQERRKPRETRKMKRPQKTKRKKFGKCKKRKVVLWINNQYVQNLNFGFA